MLELMREGLTRWLESTSFASLDDARGATADRGAHADLFERGSYIRTLQSWTS